MNVYFLYSILYKGLTFLILFWKCSHCYRKPEDKWDKSPERARVHHHFSTIHHPWNATTDVLRRKIFLLDWSQACHATKQRILVLLRPKAVMMIAWYSGGFIVSFWLYLGKSDNFIVVKGSFERSGTDSFVTKTLLWQTKELNSRLVLNFSENKFNK